MYTVKLNDIVIFTQKFRHGQEYRAAYVTKVNPDSFNFVGYNKTEFLETGQGRCEFASIGTKPFGFYCEMKVIGNDPRYY